MRSTGHVVALLRDRFFTCPDIYGWNASLEIDTTSFRCRHPLASSTPALYMRVHVTPYHMRSTTVLLISVHKMGDRVEQTHNLDGGSCASRRS